MTGRVTLSNLKANASASIRGCSFPNETSRCRDGHDSRKKRLVSKEHIASAIETMTSLNKVGEKLAELSGVNAMTDVTGFGLDGTFT